MATTKEHDLHEHVISSEAHEAQYERICRRTQAFIKALVKEELEPLMSTLRKEASTEGDLDDEEIEALYETDHDYHVNRLLHCIIGDVIDETVKSGED